MTHSQIMQLSLYFKLFCISIVLYSLGIESDSIANFQKPSPLPKYFAIDVDGTFFTSDANVFQENVEAFKKLKDKNITPFFCTGRDPASNRLLLGDEFFTQTGYNGFPGIYAGGSLVYDSDGNLLTMAKFSEDFLTKFKDHMTTTNHNARVIYVSDDKIFTLETLAPEIKNYLSMVKYRDQEIITFDELKTKNIVSIFLHSNNVQVTGLAESTDYNVTYPDKEVAHVIPPGRDKKVALEELLTHLKSKANECAYIGDAQNDRTAMAFCNTSFAVGDADDETKQKAKWVLDKKHNEGAFAKAVKLLCDD